MLVYKCVIANNVDGLTALGVERKSFFGVLPSVPQQAWQNPKKD
ncbi:MAG: hypothetical protein RLZZ312_1877 [Bacteroidota bacterium]